MNEIQTGISLDTETKELKVNMDSLYQFLDSFTMGRL